MFNVTLALGLLLAACQEQEWKTFSSKEGGFSILLPGVPKEQKKTITTPAGNLEVIFFVLENKQETFAISYAIFPPKVVETGTAEQRLNQARDGAVITLKGKLIGEKKINLGPHPGRELVIHNASPGAVVTRFYLVKDRLYQVTITGPRSLRKAPRVQKFLESFRLMK